MKQKAIKLKNGGILRKGPVLKQFQLRTNGNLLGSEIFDSDKKIGYVNEVTFVENKPLMLVKVGRENFPPTVQDLESWRKNFEESEKDGNFKIFTHPDITIETVDISSSQIKVEAKIKE